MSAAYTHLTTSMGYYAITIPPTFDTLSTLCEAYACMIKVMSSYAYNALLLNPGSGLVLALANSAGSESINLNMSYISRYSLTVFLFGLSLAFRSGCICFKSFSYHLILLLPPGKWISLFYHHSDILIMCPLLHNYIRISFTISVKCFSNLSKNLTNE